MLQFPKALYFHHNIKRPEMTFVLNQSHINKTELNFYTVLNETLI